MKKIDKDIEEMIKGRQGVTDSKPTMLDLSMDSDKKELRKLFKSGQIKISIDDYKEQQYELFAVKNPSIVYTPDFNQKFDEYFLNLQKDLPIYKQGKWVFFPWISTLVHILKDDEFQLVRTARNRNLITKEEQENFYNAIVGIGGLSIGNSVALAIVLQGGARHIKLADFDKLALSNTNRIRAGMQNLGLSKVEVTARQIYEINPYTKIDIFSEGLTPENIEEFFKGLNIIKRLN